MMTTIRSCFNTFLFLLLTIVIRYVTCFSTYYSSACQHQKQIQQCLLEQQQGRSRSIKLTKKTGNNDGYHCCLYHKIRRSILQSSLNNDDEWSDFDDYVGGEGGGGSSISDSNAASSSSTVDFTQLFQEKSGSIDLTACQTRQFVLGSDIILSNYVGNMGFDEVTDWEYYYPGEDDPEERQVVQPNPFDSTKPKRTRKSSGSVIRIFRGEFVGQMGGTLSAQGLDKRVLIKEFTGDMALGLAKSELASIGRLQSDLLSKQNKDVMLGEWIRTAATRSINIRQDNSNVMTLMKALADAPYLGILGEINLAEVEGNITPNDFYRALGVPPPKPGAIWVVYEYAGLSTIQAYAVPGEIRRANVPPRKGFFGNIIAPPSLPPFKDRANYVVKGIMKQAIIAVATMHESGLVHRSIGRTSFIISSKSADKREAVSPFNTMISQVRIKLSDFGFSTLYEKSTFDGEFCTRARTYGVFFRKGENNILTANFAIAEDMHALGFVFMGLLLTSLAELPDKATPMPATDEDTLQRLLGEIFDKDMDQFREYVEAEDIWSNLVQLLDENDRAGWKVLETLILAREKVAKNKDTMQMFTVRGLLANPFFK